MEDMEQKLNTILGNPDMMAQIMSLAQSMNAPQEPEPAPPSQGIGIDPVMLQKIAGIAQQSGIDQNQLVLLKALRPYLNEQRIIKLEKAMRAAKIAGMATTFLGGAGSLFFPGR